jgi:hypothetical protein
MKCKSNNHVFRKRCSISEYISNINFHKISVLICLSRKITKDGNDLETVLHPEVIIKNKSKQICTYLMGYHHIRRCVLCRSFFSFFIIFTRKFGRCEKTVFVVVGIIDESIIRSTRPKGEIYKILIFKIKTNRKM